MNKSIIIAVAMAITVSITAGCDTDADKTFKANNEAAFKACIDSGGVPLQAWFNESILGDCIYKHSESKGGE